MAGLLDLHAADRRACRSGRGFQEEHAPRTDRLHEQQPGGGIPTALAQVSASPPPGQKIEQFRFPGARVPALASDANGAHLEEVARARREPARADGSRRASPMAGLHQQADLEVEGPSCLRSDLQFACCRWPRGSHASRDEQRERVIGSPSSRGSVVVQPVATGCRAEVSDRMPPTTRRPARRLSMSGRRARLSGRLTAMRPLGSSVEPDSSPPLLRGRGHRRGQATKRRMAAGSSTAAPSGRSEAARTNRRRPMRLPSGSWARIEGNARTPRWPSATAAGLNDEV